MNNKARTDGAVRQLSLFDPDEMADKVAPFRTHFEAREELRALMADLAHVRGRHHRDPLRKKVVDNCRWWLDNVSRFL